MKNDQKSPPKIIVIPKGEVLDSEDMELLKLRKKRSVLIALENDSVLDRFKVNRSGDFVAGNVYLQSGVRPFEYSILSNAPYEWSEAYYLELVTVLSKFLGARSVKAKVALVKKGRLAFNAKLEASGVIKATPVSGLAEISKQDDQLLEKILKLEIEKPGFGQEEYENEFRRIEMDKYLQSIGCQSDPYFRFFCDNRQSGAKVKKEIVLTEQTGSLLGLAVQVGVSKLFNSEFKTSLETLQSLSISIEIEVCFP